MPDLELQISTWRNEMLAAGITNPATLDELETHLREEITSLIAATKSKDAAFKIAAEHLGPPAPLQAEFNKLGARNWNLPLAWAAWILFVVSFFLPAYANGRGWQCAGLSSTIWFTPDMRHDWFSLHLTLLTFANLLMVASPLLLFKFSGGPRALLWNRCFHFVALILVWSFMGLLLANEDRHDLKIGSYVWAASFLLLFLSLFRRRSQKAQYV